MPFGIVPPRVSLPLLAAWESLIGLVLWSAALVIGATVRGGGLRAEPDRR